MTTETLSWYAHDQHPDVDQTVLVRLIDADEPVWLGYWDGTDWCVIEGFAVNVLRWAAIPQGG